MIEIGEVEARVTAKGTHTGYKLRVYHSGLNEVRHLAAADLDILQGKLDNLVYSWEQKWERQQAAEARKEAALQKTQNVEEAKEQTKKAQIVLDSMQKLLRDTLTVDDTVNWSTLKNTTSFPKPEPKKPNLAIISPEPKPEDFQKPISIFSIVFGQKEKVLERQHQEFRSALEQWEKDKKKTISANKRTEKLFKEKLAKWQSEKEAFENTQQVLNDKVDALRKRYLSSDEEAVVEYCEIVLTNSKYPDEFPSDFEIEYSAPSGMLVVDFALPDIEALPKMASVRYIASRDTFEEKYLSEAKLKAMYNSVCYQIAIRTLHELFEADSVSALEAVTFNGYVTRTNPATGHLETNCILSVQANKTEFSGINLESVDAKACFRALKGVGSANLATITPVKPLLELDKSDKRFRDHYEIVSELDNSTNLAAMDWEDFEHLVRELFEAEFASNGGEVRVTQASADGGVDAVAFDPDPIRGGKIVIQAKRYTNTVGVAAVRDLFGTVMNEGANKGILVTTSDYGADSYNFAKDKPITLLNGSNLLHLLEKHGRKAKIDIREAKRIMSQQV